MGRKVSDGTASDKRGGRYECRLGWWAARCDTSVKIMFKLYISYIPPPIYSCYGLKLSVLLPLLSTTQPCSQPPINLAHSNFSSKKLPSGKRPSSPPSRQVHPWSSSPVSRRDGATNHGVPAHLDSDASMTSLAPRLASHQGSARVYPPTPAHSLHRAPQTSRLRSCPLLDIPSPLPVLQTPPFRKPFPPSTPRRRKTRRTAKDDGLAGGAADQRASPR